MRMKYLRLFSVRSLRIYGLGFGEHPFSALFFTSIPVPSTVQINAAFPNFLIESQCPTSFSEVWYL